MLEISGRHVKALRFLLLDAIAPDFLKAGKLGLHLSRELIVLGSQSVSYHFRALREGSEEDEENAARTDDKDRKRYRHCKSHRELHEGCRYVGQHT